VRYHCLIPITAALANLLICALVARQGLRDRLRRTFLGMALAIVSWNLDIFALYYVDDMAAAEWWSRVFRTGICLAPPAIFHFSLVLSEARGALWLGLLTAGYGVGLLLALANLSGLLVTRLTPHQWGWYPQPGPLYGVFAASLAVFLLLWIERVWHTCRHPASARRRSQAKFWLLASLVQIPFVLTNFLPIYGINIYPLGNIGNVLFTGIIAYAIVRHRLMDVDYIVRKGVSFALAAVVVLLPGGLGLNALARATGADEPVVYTCAALGLALVAVVVIPTLQEALETRLHRALFRNRYDYRRRLRELATEVVHMLSQGELVKQLGEALVDILDVERCEIFVHDEQARRLVRAFPLATTSEPVEEPVARAIGQLRELALASELEEADNASALRGRGWEVVIPLRVSERLSGFIAIGPNRDLRIFSAEDIQLLTTLAGSVTVALENTRYSRRLRRSEAVLERANRLSSLGTLAAGIAHEIRNPLVAVKTFLDLLPERLDDKEFLENFRRLSLSEIKRVTNLLSDLLSLGKTTTAGRRAVALRETVEPVLRLMESTAHKRQVQLVEAFDPRLPSVWADPDQLKQITLNLLLNAIEVSPEGGKVHLTVRATADQTDEPPVVLEVRDQGPGIQPEQIEDIFLPFFTTKDTGTGLGLALVHQMVVEHGGEITVESSIGSGTTFRVTLPAARAEQLADTG